MEVRLIHHLVADLNKKKQTSVSVCVNVVKSEEATWFKNNQFSVGYKSEM